MLNVYVGKNYDEILAQALEELKLKEEDVIVSKKEVKKSLFKGKELELTVTPLKDVMEYIKGYLQKVLTSMGLDVSFESQIREKQLKVKIYSDDNSLLIGHTGKNLSALQTIVRSVVKNKYGVTPYISLDVENYKDKQIMYLQKTAKRIAREVSKTKQDVELDNMNSYERLVVHEAIKDFKHVYSESTGEEPNRHVVIKYKEEEEN